jgi:NADP-dependent 3-hydroxy acid dehydrogenase YdfG
MSKIIFITGTSTGFGRLMTITLSKAGHTVVAGMRGTTEKNMVVAGELAELPNVEVVEIDVVSDDQSRRRLKKLFQNTAGWMCW